MRKYDHQSIKRAELDATRNVDRLFAIWQAIYTNTTVTPQVNAAGTYTDDPGTMEDANTRQSTPPLFSTSTDTPSLITLPL